MTYEEALKHYLRKARYAKQSIQRLMLWDQKKTILEMSKILKTTYSNTLLTARFYGLKFVKGPRGRRVKA